MCTFLCVDSWDVVGNCELELLVLQRKYFLRTFKTLCLGVFCDKEAKWSIRAALVTGRLVPP